MSVWITWHGKARMITGSEINVTRVFSKYSKFAPPSVPARSLNIEGLELLLSRGELFGNAYGKLSNAMLFRSHHDTGTLMANHAIYSTQTRCISGTTVCLTVIIYTSICLRVSESASCKLNTFVVWTYCIGNFILPRKWHKLTKLISILL